MTGYTVHTGSSIKFSKGWDKIFEEAKSGKKNASKPPATVKSAAKPAKKSAATKSKKTIEKAAQPQSTKSTKKAATSKSGKRGK